MFGCIMESHFFSINSACRPTLETFLSNVRCIIPVSFVSLWSDKGFFELILWVDPSKWGISSAPPRRESAGADSCMAQIYPLSWESHQLFTCLTVHSPYWFCWSAWSIQGKPFKLKLKTDNSPAYTTKKVYNSVLARPLNYVTEYPTIDTVNTW